MIGDSLLPLREVVERLSAIPRFPKRVKPCISELYKLLRTAKIRACIEFPSIRAPALDIPVQFWCDLRSGQFMNSLVRTAHHRKGYFLVPATALAQVYANW